MRKILRENLMMKFLREILMRKILRKRSRVRKTIISNFSKMKKGMT